MEYNLLAISQAILEMTGIVAFSFALAGVPLRWGRIILTGAILASVVLGIRALPVTFGIHTVATLLLLVFLMTKIARVPPTRSFITVFVCFTTLAVLELVIHELFFGLTRMDQQTVMANRSLWKLLGFPQALLMILFAVLTSKFKKPVQGAWKI